MERTYSPDGPATLREPTALLAAYEAGVMAICRLAARFDRSSWSAQTPCSEWRACDVAAHLRCIADDLHEYLDEAPMSRYARLMATGARPDSLARKIARQNAAELAVLADGPPDDHVAAFASAARRYAARLSAVWDLPHHQYRDTVVTVGGMAGAACAEWHLHASDLAAALGIDYRPADPDAVLAGWLAGMPHVAPPAQKRLVGWHVRHADPWQAVLAASGRRAGADAGRSVGRWSPVRWTARPLLRKTARPLLGKKE